MISFDGACSWSFDNEFAKNVVILGVDNSSSSHKDSHKNNLIVIVEVPTDDINDYSGFTEKKSSVSILI